MEGVETVNDVPLTGAVTETLELLANSPLITANTGYAVIQTKRSGKVRQTLRLLKMKLQHPRCTAPEATVLTAVIELLAMHAEDEEDDEYLLKLARICSRLTLQNC